MSVDMCAADARPERRVLVFGPLALSFDKPAVERLISQLRHHAHSWLLEVIIALPDLWETLYSAIPTFLHPQSHNALRALSEACESGAVQESLFPLPNAVLSLLTVATHLQQYGDYLTQISTSESGYGLLQPPIVQHTEVLGLCIGSLSAVAVSCSPSRSQLQEHGAVVARLAMAAGAVVDAAELAASSSGPWRSMSISWAGSEPTVGIESILLNFPSAYISNRTDEERATVTAPALLLEDLRSALRTAGMHVLDLSLIGQFHSPVHDEALRALVQFCESDSRLQLPNVMSAAFSLRSRTPGQLLPSSSLHEIALRDVLINTPDWVRLFQPVCHLQSETKGFNVITFGPERCMPPTVARKLGSCVSHVTSMRWELPASMTTRAPDSGTQSQFEALPDNRVAIVGMSCHAPNARDLNQYWAILSSGQSQHTEVPLDRFEMETPWRPLDPRRKWYGNFIQDYDKFDHKFFKRSPREAATADPQQRLTLQLAYQAVEQSGYYRPGKSRDDQHIACYVGIGNNDYQRNIDCYPANAYSAKGNLRGFIAGSVSHFFGWTGPSFTIDSACSSSSVAIHHACRAVLSGECTAALAGGINIFTNPDWFHDLSGASFLSPTGQCKPFDAAADGYCRGEGAGFVFLKSLSTAVADGDQVLGVIASSTVYQNQNCTAITVPNAPSLAKLFVDVVRQARLEPRSISLVEAHGTGTAVGDPAEYDGIRKSLGSSVRDDNLYLTSVKGSIGHCEFSSGVLSLLKVLLMIHKGEITPQASFHSINPSLNASKSDCIEIPTKLQPWNTQFRAALINNYGASGSNASMIVTQPPANANKAPLSSAHITAGQKYPFWLSGLDDRSLRAYVAKLKQYLQAHNDTADLGVRNLSFQLSRQSNRTLTQSLLFTASSGQELVDHLTSFERSDTASLPKTKMNTRPVILCFGGQISTYIGLDRSVFNQVAVLRICLERCDSACVSIGLSSIFPDIFDKTAITDIVKLQTCLFAMQYSCATAWIACGTNIAAMVGHSFGELVALCVAGAYSLVDALKLVSGRARIIQQSWVADKGSMLAVEADFVDLKVLLLHTKSVLGSPSGPSIACYNGLRSFTIGGSSLAIEVMDSMIRQDPRWSAIKAKKLNVTHAFHTALAESLRGELLLLGQEIKLEDTTIHVERATAHGSDPLDSSFIFEHLRNPVFFRNAVERLQQRFPSAIWLEAGSGSTVTTMASRALDGPKGSYFQALALAEEDSLNRLAKTTAKLWGEGLNVEFWLHHKSQILEYTSVILPPYQFEPCTHWLELKPVPSSDPTTSSDSKGEPPTGLTTLLSYKNKERTSAQFRINSASTKFREQVAATFVIGTAHMPSSMLQIDAVLDALSVLRPDITSLSLQPEALETVHRSAFVIESAQDLLIDLASTDCHSLNWQWSLSTADSSGNLTHHTTGTIVLRSATDMSLKREFDRLERLIKIGRCTCLLNDPDVDEILQGRSIYRAFESVVAWGAPYHHVAKLSARDMETAAVVRKTYEATGCIDSVLSECFCQVASFHLNLMKHNAQGVFICKELGRWARNPSKTNGKSLPSVWHIYVTHQRDSPTVITSDVFVYDPRDGSLCEIVLGIQYQQLAVETLRRTFTLSAQRGSRKPGAEIKSHPVESISITPPLVMPTTESVPNVKPQPAASSTKDILSSELQPGVPEKARQILCNLAGVEPEDVKGDSDLIELGVDSLMAMEVNREIDATFNCTLSNEQMMDLTDFDSLVKCIRSTLGLSDEPIGTSSTDDQPDTISESSSTLRDIDGWADAFSPMKASHPLSRFELGGHNRSVHSSDDSTVESINSTRLLAETGTLTPNTENSIQEHRYCSTAETTAAWSERVLLDSFRQLKWTTDDFIVEGGLNDYVSTVIPKSTSLCIAYVVDAFEQLGCSIRAAVPGQHLVPASCLPKHRSFLEILYRLLEHEGHLITVKSGVISRTSVPAPSKLAEDILAELCHDKPAQASEFQLTALLGRNLAQCLKGELEGVQVLFSQGKETLADMYANSPFTGIWTSQLEFFLKELLSTHRSFQEPIRILEIGAGTGGTSAKLINMLAKLNVPIEYTMTDISGSLVAAARKRFKQHTFMTFRVLDIEKPPIKELVQNQHIILSTNCVHATRNLSMSLANIRQMLRPDGFLILLEMTQQLPWVDLVFGPLDGWWLFEDDRKYVLASAWHWEGKLHSVGYGHVDWTEGQLPEADIQRLIIAHAGGTRYSRGQKPPSPQQLNMPMKAEDRQAMVDAYIYKHTESWSVSPTRAVATGQSVSMAKTVLVTGATGSLGSHLVAELARRPDISMVVCLNRLSNTDANARQRESLKSRGIELDSAAGAKLKVIATDTSKLKLGLAPETYVMLVATTTHIVHSAWPMSLTRPIKGYEIQFKVLRNLIDLAQEAADSRPAPFRFGFQFISSIAVVGSYPEWAGRALVPEQCTVIDTVPRGGYAEAKMTCEYMLNQTLYRHPDRFHAMAVRIAQISGSSASGHWNPTEYVPILAKSSQALRMLPDLDGTFAWCPVDQVAASLGELLVSRTATDLIYHIDNPCRQPWKHFISLLARLLDIPSANIVPHEQWTRAVREFKGSNSDNPAMLLADFFDSYFVPMSCGGLILDVSKTKQYSKTLREMKVVADGLLINYIESWRKSGFLH